MSRLSALSSNSTFDVRRSVFGVSLTNHSSLFAVHRSLFTSPNGAAAGALPFEHDHRDRVLIGVA
jgi:hypothetical protein